jgi:hypothetical protein
MPRRPTQNMGRPGSTAGRHASHVISAHLAGQIITLVICPDLSEVSQRLSADHFVLELDEDESSFGDVADLAGLSVTHCRVRRR